MDLDTETYLNQKERWQPRGKVILAQYDAKLQQEGELSVVPFS